MVFKILRGATAVIRDRRERRGGGRGVPVWCHAARAVCVMVSAGSKFAMPETPGNVLQPATVLQRLLAFREHCKHAWSINRMQNHELGDNSRFQRPPSASLPSRSRTASMVTDSTGEENVVTMLSGVDVAGAELLKRLGPECGQDANKSSASFDELSPLFQQSAQ